ncbi:unnamed protein product [Diatraea saccharalis]|uniref:F-box domain-containing protein n=1 Tax=Diatraea saccharalis TaxID=40085 RepID=A0A9N9R5M1_9NEOP|nr:unnamed protein product [Diatraea saccharalis]
MMDSVESGIKMDILSLPVVVLENIFSYLSYDEIAKNRIVSKAFNDICMRLLNRGFLMIERRHALALKAVKTQLPRRESERRYHPLSRHSDILTSLETRISMLNMTYTKFIDNGICCFIPGKVIDEIRRVLTIVETTKTPPRAHEVLQELRDISSMAIEHFDDKISPAFRKKLQDSVVPPPPRPAPGVLAPIAIRQDMLLIRRRLLLNTKLSLYLTAQQKKFHKRMFEYRKIAWRQRKTIRCLMRRQKEQDNTIADLRKRIEECDIKYSELTHTNQAVGGKVIAVLPNIKPRKPLINLPSLSEDDAEPPPKIPKIDDQPSTSKPKPQSTIAKIRGIANEIRTLTNLNIEGKLKRPVPLNPLAILEVEVKKQKLD